MGCSEFRVLFSILIQQCLDLLGNFQIDVRCGIGDDLSNPKDLIKKCFLSFNVNIFGLSCDGKIRTIGKKEKKDQVYNKKSKDVKHLDAKKNRLKIYLTF